MAAHGTGQEETKKATVNGLAVAGFIALVIAGMLLAIYAAHYVPQLLSNLSSAVYLSSDKPENETPPPTPRNDTPVVVTPEAPTPATSTPAQPKPTTPTTGGPYYPATPTYTTTGPRLYGLPDLALTDVRAGYFSGSTFIEDDRVSGSRDLGIKFTVRNSGTNVVSGYLVRVRVEGQAEAIGRGGLLYPNGYQTFTIRVTDPDSGNLTTRIEIDYPGVITETNERNNDDTIDVDVGGSSSSHSRLSCDITASPSRIDDGERTTLRWDTRGADDARINQGIGRVDEDGGSIRVSPDEDTTYRLTVENDDGDEETCSVTVRVD